jgi:hypothetical protein
VISGSSEEATALRNKVVGQSQNHYYSAWIVKPKTMNWRQPPVRHSEKCILPILSLLMLILWANQEQCRAEESGKADPWQAIRFLAGEWRGTAQGEPGVGSVQRTYSFVLKDKYLYERNISTYAQKEKDRSSEVHEHWSMFSYDSVHKNLVLRQFHQEGFVNRYVMRTSTNSPTRIMFESEEFENFDNSWNARETYEIISPDEFVETFEPAAPGKPFQIYSRSHFKRVNQP